MRIQDLEKHTGLDRATIRYYEREGLIAPQRTENGYRDYSQADAEQLMKIRLLRQLEFPLEKIKDLQQGSTSISDAMDDQIELLENKLDTTVAALKICRMLKDNAAAYDTMEVETYLLVLDESSQKGKFREEVSREIHPFRRYAARQLDWAIIVLLLNWLVYSVVRIRPQEEFVSVLIVASGLLISIFTEAVMVYYFGTTPGKWLAGIRVEPVNGGKLEYDESMWRARLAAQEAMGFRIPIWSEIKMVLNYKAYTEGYTLEWEEDTELRYKKFEVLRIAAMVIVYLLTFSCLAAVTFDASYMPKNRDGRLSVAEFVENYNGYAKEAGSLNVIQQGPVMMEDGEWEPLSMIEKGYIREHPVYICNAEGNIQRIELTGRFMYDAEVCEWITAAVIGAQTDVSLVDMIRFRSGDEFDDQVNQPIRDGKTAGEYQLENVQVTWIYEITTDTLYFAVTILDRTA